MKTESLIVKRPSLPDSILHSLEEEFEPAPGLEVFIRETFLNEDSKLFNPDHLHLAQARIGYLWTNAANSRQMKTVVGTAEIPKPPTQSGMWQKARYRKQIRDWFGPNDLDFLITISAPYAVSCDEVNFCALIEHELYHCAQRLDEFGSPKFSRTTGLPIFGLKGHDLEEFVGVVRRYGAKAGAGETNAFIQAARKKPEIAAADIRAICGTCG